MKVMSILNPFRLLTTAAPAAFALILTTGGCPGDPTDPEPEGNEEEVVTAVELTFAPSGGGADVVAIWEDPENDGAPVIDDIVLADGETYALSIRFLNQLEDPAENITEEIEEEDDEHQVFIYGDAVDGPGTDSPATAIVTHEYDDQDGDGLPIGLANTIVATGTGTETFSVMLRHLPPENDAAVKVEGLAEDFAADGTNGIAGDVDADVDFNLTVE